MPTVGGVRLRVRRASRNVRPLFVNREITIGGEPSLDNKTAKLWAADDTGALALTAEAEFV